MESKKELFFLRIHEFQQRKNVRAFHGFIQKNGVAVVFSSLIGLIVLSNTVVKTRQLEFREMQTKVPMLLERYEEGSLAEEQIMDTEKMVPQASSVMLASIGSIANPLLSDENENGGEQSGTLAMMNQGLVASASVLTTVSQDLDSVTAEQESLNQGETQEEEPKKKVRKLIENYVVQEGDTLSTIAAVNGITTATLLQSNGLNETSNIQPGDSLSIPAASGIVVTVKKGDTLSDLVKTYKANAEKTVVVNNIAGDAIRIGQKILLVNGSAPPPPKPTPAPASTKTATNSGAKSTAKAKEVSKTPDPYHKPVASGYSYGRVHSNNGVDISRNNGASVYAFKDGTVIEAATGWSGGYGNVVKIQHADGTVTLYGHLSQIYVGNGQTVEKGQVVGTVGSTGRSTGPHLHFEVRGGTNPYAGYVGDI